MTPILCLRTYPVASSGSRPGGPCRWLTGAPWADPTAPGGPGLRPEPKRARRPQGPAGRRRDTSRTRSTREQTIARRPARGDGFWVTWWRDVSLAPKIRQGEHDDCELSTRIELSDPCPIPPPSPASTACSDRLSCST